MRALSPRLRCGEKKIFMRIHIVHTNLLEKITVMISGFCGKFSNAIHQQLTCYQAVDVSIDKNGFFQSQMVTNYKPNVCHIQNANDTHIIAVEE